MSTLLGKASAPRDLCAFSSAVLESGYRSRFGLGEWSILCTGFALWGHGKVGEELGPGDFPFPSIS